MYMGHYYLKNSTSVKSMFKKVYYLHLAIVEGTTSSSFYFLFHPLVFTGAFQARSGSVVIWLLFQVCCGDGTETH